MARIKGLGVTNLQGRLGNMVFRNRGGENIVSQRPASVKNPRTEGQQFQRMLMNTVIQAYSGLKFICDHSFEGKRYGAESMQYFMKRNLNLLRGSLSEGDAAFVAKGNASVAPNRYLVSEGSLTPITYKPVTEFPDSLVVPSDLPAATTLAALTVAQFLAMFNAEPGDQITLANIGTGDVFAYGNWEQAGRTYATYHRIVLKDSFDSSELTQPVFVVSGQTARLNPDWYSEDSRNAESIEFGKTTDIDQKFFQLVVTPAVEGENFVASALILSRKVSGVWARSTQYAIPTTVADYGNAYVSDNVIQTYDPSSPLYLNNAKK